MTKAEKETILNRDNTIKEWFDLYGYGDLENTKESSISSYNEAGTIYAVINTPKMATGTLQGTFSTSLKCKGRDPIRTVNLSGNCERDQKVMRSHDFDAAVEYIQEHRGSNPNGRCHIVTALRSPNQWFASLYNEKTKADGHCPDVNIPSDERVRNFKTFLSTSRFGRAFDTLGRLLNEYDVSLTSQFRLMDKNGGYSVLGPAPDNSIIAGCELLFLRIEDSERWPDIFRKMFPGIGYRSGKSRSDMCPKATDTLKILEEYVMTKAEQETILSGDNTIKEWFDLYDY